MKKLIVALFLTQILFSILISVNIILLALPTKVNTEVIETDVPNFAVIVDDDAQESYIVAVLDVIDKEESVVIVTSNKDIEAEKEEVIFCKTYSEADVWLEIVSGLNG